MKKLIICWSSGKDSAMALYKIRQTAQYEISCLLTTVMQGYDKISMHGVRKELVMQQAEALSLPLEVVYIPKGSSNAEYEHNMEELLLKQKQKGVKTVSFGDIFLEDLRQYRLAHLAKIGMKGLFPLWKQNTSELADEFIKLGFRAIVTCVDTQFLGKEFCAREFDKSFLADLPENVDPCGENGEFHTFVFAGPLFRKDIIYDKGEIILSDNRFYHCDILPKYSS